MTGRTLGDFLMGEPFQAGGYGVIYHATQKSLQRDVVVKVMRWRGQRDDAATRRFLREAQLAARLDHPYAAHIYSFGAESDGVLWIAMELVRGTSLKAMLDAQGSLPLTRFVPLLEKLAEVIHSAHQQGIIHRDIKPSNVMVVARAGRLLPKLLDLGIARVLGDTEVIADENTADVASADVGADGSSTDPSSSSRPVGRPVSRPASSSETPGESRRPTQDSSDFELPFDTPLSSSGGSSNSEPLTGRGTSLGSPPYMAPEQWVSASNSDARSDQYSLAILAYEVTTGRRPFQGPDAKALSLAHRHGQMPSLDDEFADELEDVLLRALAKEPEHRFDDVLHFARAFREAAGLDNAGENDPLPRLNPTLREALLARAPQPLADSVALLEASHDPLRALEAAFQVIRVAVRLVGLISVATLATFGMGTGSAAEQARTALRRLRRKMLTSNDWLDIARTLTAPFVRAPDIHPVPELVLLFHRHRSSTARMKARGDTDSQGSVLDDLVALEREAHSDEPHTALQGMLPVLDHLLGQLDFLSEYRMVVRRDGRNEVWMGARRSARATMTPRGPRRDLAEGDVLLVGKDDDPLVVLSPLCSARQPAPGTPPELFLFDGRSRFGARMVAFPVGFEWHDNEFWTWFQDHLVELDPNAGEDGDDDADARPPYKGLAAFSAEDAADYFGRESEVRACVNRLKIDPLLAVVGPSGAGKSSLVYAGILPSLPDNWHYVTTRPGPAPMTALAASLAHTLAADGGEGDSGSDAKATADELRQRLDENPAFLGEFLRDRATDSGRVLVLVVDQFEELLTLSSDHGQRARYSAALMSAATSAEQPVRVIVTMRDDFLLRAQTLPALRERLGPSLQLLATPPPDELERILLEPARRAGYEFEDPDLPAEMVEAIADEPGALALLSFTASKLWEMRDRTFRRLRRASYKSLGGVGGALAQHAEDMLAAMSESSQAMVREAFRQLVTADGTRAVLTRRELSQILGSRREADDVLEHLISARLLVASEGAGGVDRVEVVHEALLSSWPRLLSWRQEDAESARLRDQLRGAARQWVAREQPQGLLWRGDALLEYRVWRARYQGALTDDEQAFAVASLKQEARGERRRRIGLFAVFTGLLVGLLIALQLRAQADKQRVRADSERQRAEGERQRAEEFAGQSRDRLLALYQEQGRLAMLAGQPITAFAYLTEARAGGGQGPALDLLLGTAGAALDDLRWAVDAHENTIFALAYSSDGERIATGSLDGTIKVWDAARGHLLATLTGHEQRVWGLSFSPDGALLASAGWDNKALIWDVQSGALKWTAQHEGSVNWALFSPDGQRLATAGSDKAVKLWTVDSGQLVATLTHPARLISGAFSPDGTHLATGSSRGETRYWRLATGELVHATKAPAGLVSSVAFSPDGRVLGSATSAGTAHLLTIESGETRTLNGHSSGVNRIRFSPDGTRLLTASEDKTIKVWSAAKGALVRDLKGHTGGVTDAHFSADGRRIVSVSRDATGRLFDAETGLRIWTYLGHEDAIWAAAVNSSTDQLATISFAGGLRVWRTDVAVYERAVPTRDSEVLDLALSPDETLLASARLIDGDDRDFVAVDVWAITDGPIEERPIFSTQVPTVGTFVRPRVEFSRDGRLLAISGSNAASIWRFPDKLQVAELTRDDGYTTHAVFDRDGTGVFLAGTTGAIELWSLNDRRRQRSLTGHTGTVRSLALDPDGQFLVSGGEDKVVRIFLVATGAQVTSWSDPSMQQLIQARFGPKGQRVITTSFDKTARVWTATGELLMALDGHSSAIFSGALGPDGLLAATASHDGTVKIWELSSGAQLWSTDDRPGIAASAVLFVAGDRHRLLTARGRQAHFWRLPDDRREPAALRAFAVCRLGRALKDNRLIRTKIDHEACNRQEVTGSRQR